MYWLRRWWVSPKFNPARATRISSSPSPGSGTGISATRSTSGPSELLDLNGSHHGGSYHRYPCPPYEPCCSRIDRLRRGQDTIRRAREDARRLGRPLLARGQLLHRRARRRAGRRRLRRRRVRGAARPRRQHRRHRARRGRRDLLLARPLRVRLQPGPHRRHPAQRLRRLRAEAVGGLAGGRPPLPREHPARPPARRARAVPAARAAPASTR